MDVNAALTRLRNGESQRAVAADLGMDPKTLRTRLAAGGASPPSKRGRKRVADPEETLRLRDEGGLSMQAIADYLGVSLQAVTTALDSAGYTRATPQIAGARKPTIPEVTMLRRAWAAIPPRQPRNGVDISSDELALFLDKAQRLHEKGVPLTEQSTALGLRPGRIGGLLNRSGRTLPKHPPKKTV